jgi:hypothetical protein
MRRQWHSITVVTHLSGSYSKAKSYRAALGIRELGSENAKEFFNLQIKVTASLFPFPPPI